MRRRTVAVVAVDGMCRADFAPVRAAFVHNFADGLEAGARAAVVLRGKVVVDLWAGAGWHATTLTTVFSATKGVAALVAAMLVDRGLLDYEEPVVRY